MKIASALLVLLGSMNAMAGGAVCGKYSAVVANSGKPITIVSQASDYASGVGYTFIETTISGAIAKTCGQFFGMTDRAACNVNVKNVVLVTSSDCWETSVLRCQVAAEKMASAILSIQEKRKIQVRTTHSDSVTDEIGNTVEAYDIQGYSEDVHGKKIAVRSISRVRMFVEDNGCSLLDYSLPNAN